MHLERRCLDFFNGDRRFWALRDELLSLGLKVLEGPLQAVFPDLSTLAKAHKEILLIGPKPHVASSEPLVWAPFWAQG